MLRSIIPVQIPSLHCIADLWDQSHKRLGLQRRGMDWVTCNNKICCCEQRQETWLKRDVLECICYILENANQRHFTSTSRNCIKNREEDFSINVDPNQTLGYMRTAGTNKINYLYKQRVAFGCKNKSTHSHTHTHTHTLIKPSRAWPTPPGHLFVTANHKVTSPPHYVIANHESIHGVILHQ